MSKLTPGAVLFGLPADRTALRSPEGEVLDIALPPEVLAAVRATLSGSAQAPPELAAFAASGFLGRRRSWPTERATVGILAADDLAESYADLLRGHGAQPRLLTGTDSLDGLAAVCALHDGPAPEWWTELDELPDRGIAWQRISREGRHALLEPVAATAADVRHRDVRLRRLAAAGSGHEHLSAYWAQRDVLTGAEQFDPADLNLVLAAAALDLRVWATDQPTRTAGSLVTSELPANRRLRVLDLDTGAITDHPVLRVPDCAP
ncbi:hypothetical protein [Crossiella cryophila]|uniref:Uncharacterized protein n=1 Tax=Crossiella cryophila TaxID=43355 RepID=A0A7W7C5Y8_9PSEU|nr:hypothetical protein [Crossiella cryophila]MBB4675134.1 hypothetical protein [Crossiella cryophila]